MDWNQGNKILAGSKLLLKFYLLQVWKMWTLRPTYQDADLIMIHYADKTKEIKVITQKESKVQQVREYSIEGLVILSIHQIWLLKIGHNWSAMGYQN